MVLVGGLGVRMFDIIGQLTAFIVEIGVLLIIPLGLVCAVAMCF
jgi:hypothetical protein